MTVNGQIDNKKKANRHLNVFNTVISHRISRLLYVTLFLFPKKNKNPPQNSPRVPERKSIEYRFYSIDIKNKTTNAESGRGASRWKKKFIFESRRPH